MLDGSLVIVRTALLGRQHHLLIVLGLFSLASMMGVAFAAPPDNTPPTIDTPMIQPLTPGYSDPVTVNVNVTDNRSGVKNVTILYTTDNWTSVNKTVTATYNATTNLATGQIPALSSGGHVSYYLVSFDNDENRGVNNNGGSYFSYDVTAPPVLVTTMTYAILAGVIASIAVAATYFLKKSSRTKLATDSVNRN